MDFNEVTLVPATEKDIPYLKEKIMEAFAVAAVERFGEEGAGRVPQGDQLEKAYGVSDSRVYCVMKGGTIVGGAVLKINEETWHNKLDLFFIFKEYHSQGLGLDAWKANEWKYPQTVVWELVTPYFEKRNIHFYVNKCGFHIVEFFNKYQPDPLKPFAVDEIEDDGNFRFEKWM